MSDALMVLDMQMDLLAVHGRNPVSQDHVEGLLRATNQAVAGAVASGAPVIYVHNAYRAWDPGNLFRGGCCVRGRPGSEFDPRLDVVSGAMTFEKWRGSAFCNDELGAWLEREGVTSLAVAGVYTNGCVAATVRGALRRELSVTVLSDAVAARDESATQKSLAKMQRAGATVASVETWLKSEGVDS